MVVLVLCCFATAAEAAEKKLPVEGEVFTIEGRTAFLILPTKTEAEAPIPWVWYAPTLPGLPGKHEKWMFDKFLDKNSAELHKRYAKLGGKMKLEIVEGQGHNLWPGWFQNQDLVDFVITHARAGK